jgi:hypothetical protein
MVAVENVVKVNRKELFGREMFEPENKTAELFCEFCGRLNLTLEQLKILTKLGFKIQQVVPKIEGL